jgi:Na+/H+ antiporter NhaA
LGAEGSALLGQAKLGVLLGSIISAAIGCVLLNKTLPNKTNSQS